MTHSTSYESSLLRLQDAWLASPDKPEETPRNTLLALWSTAAGKPLSAIAAADIEPAPLDDDAGQRLDALIAQRVEGVPLAHLTGRQHFMGMDLVAGPEALIPRRETELLAHAAISLAREACSTRGESLVVDICTGSGNVALAVAHNVHAARVFGADLSEEAVGLAQRNAEMLGIASRVAFRAGDLLSPFDEPAFQGTVDVLTCNPPYISSGKVEGMAREISAHEPRLAFDGGPLGVSILARLMQESPRFVRAGGWLAFEVGLGQGSAMARRLRNDAAWDEVRELQDEHGTVRALAARRASAEGAGA